MENKDDVYEPRSRTSMSSSDVPSIELQNQSKYFRPGPTRLISTSSFILAFMLLISNGIWAWTFAGRSLKKSLGESSYQSPENSVAQISKPLYWNTAFSDNDKNVSNPLWAGLFPPGSGLVTMSKSWAASQNLPVSKENPADKSQMIYFVAALHQLHCLTVVRASLLHLKEGEELNIPWKHVTHCLDSLRQLVMCKTDDTLLYTEDAMIFGDGQIRRCADWGALAKWAADHAYIQAS